MIEVVKSGPLFIAYRLSNSNVHLFCSLSHPYRSDAATTSNAPVVKYPAMSQQEIEEWLEHIPVFAVTDPNGAGVILKPENDTSVFYFFINPLQANATLQQLLGSNAEMNLKVSAFSLGKIWFNILNSDEEKEVLVSISIYLVLKTDLSNDWLTFLNHS
jgi:Tic22-like family